MAKKKDKRSRVTLRVDPPIHARIAKVAPKLGLDVNGVVTLLIIRGLRQVELEAAAYQALDEQDDESLLEALEDWKKRNRKRPKTEFIMEYIKMLMGEPSSIPPEYDPSYKRKRQPALPDVDGPVTVITAPRPQ